MDQEFSQKYEMILFDNHKESSETFTSRFLRRLPGSDLALERLKQVEQRILGIVKQRLDQIEPHGSSTGYGRSIHAQFNNNVDFTLSENKPLHERFADLLAESQLQTHEESEYCLFEVILQSLVPDQARILAALSDGATYPLIHVEAGSRFGWTGLVVECVSSVGKNAGVQCHELTHIYVQRLRAMGLVVIDPIESNETMKYQILETESIVRATLERLKKNGQRSRILRQTLRMSDLGQRLWLACQPDEN